MLNISDNMLSKDLDLQSFRSFKMVALSKGHRGLVRWLTFALLGFIVVMFLPWTQNIQSKGKLTTLKPEQRPQTIPSAIPGRIEKWYVQEGELIEKGDTIVHISEIKSEYFDPEIVNRTKEQVRAKESSIEAYQSKAKALEDQIDGLKAELPVKQNQLRNKLRQLQYKITSDSIEVERAKVDYNIAVNQLKRIEELYEEGLEPLTAQESRQIKMQDTYAKLVSVQNKLQDSRQEQIITELELGRIGVEYAQKISKAQSDLASALSAQFEAEGDVNKLRIEASNYEARQDFHFILAPQDCYVTKAIKPGIGETVKEGDPVVSIVPSNYELAVELFVRPMDLPLIDQGQEVRFIFDGWPAFIFSGWPGQSFGTYAGEVVAIDNMISINGQYRLLVGPAQDTPKEWPDALRPGSGANGIVLLKTVPLWYELWRRLNGFPPDFYNEQADAGGGIKFDSPAKSLK